MADIAFEKDLSVAETGIEGLKVVDLAVHGDSRGWFKENWQRAKMTALGIPDLRVVQNNISYNDSRGVTRGIHAEPWDKFISVARGSRLRRLGGPARGQRDLRQGVHLHARPVQGHLRPARRGQLLPGPGGRHRLHLPGGRPLVARAQEDLHLREPRRPRARHRVAHPSRRGHRLRGRPQPPDARRCRPHGAEAHPRHRLQRPAGPCCAQAGGGARRGQGLRLLRHRHLRHVRPGGLLHNTTGRSTAP